MEAGAEFAEALREAQMLGYAEADPTEDVAGYDARAKLTILSRIALGAQIDPEDVPAGSIVPIAAIDFAYAHELKCTIRQISRAQLVPDSSRHGSAGAGGGGADVGSAGFALCLVAGYGEHGAGEREIWRRHGVFRAWSWRASYGGCGGLGSACHCAWIEGAEYRKPEG